MRKPPLQRILSGLPREFAGAAGVGGDHGKLIDIVGADASLVVLGPACFIDSKLGAETKYIEQEHAGFGPASCRLPT